jgi:hypothetical protein
MLARCLKVTAAARHGELLREQARLQIVGPPLLQSQFAISCTRPTSCLRRTARIVLIPSRLAIWELPTTRYSPWAAPRTVISLIRSKADLGCPQTWREERHGMSIQYRMAEQQLIRYSFNQEVLVDTTPMPDHIPKVAEIGASSAPLMSASYFIGARCKAYNDDYMQCKTEAYGRGELDCMKEGRKVTRCAASV